MFTIYTAFPSILNGTVNKCYKLVSTGIFCLFPLHRDSFLICNVWRWKERTFFCSLIFVSLVRTAKTSIFQAVTLKVVCSVCGICRIVFTHVCWCYPLHHPLIKSMLPLRADSFWNPKLRTLQSRQINERSKVGTIWKGNKITHWGWQKRRICETQWNPTAWNVDTWIGSWNDHQKGNQWKMVKSKWSLWYS